LRRILPTRPVEETRDYRSNDREAERGQKPAVHAGRVLRHDHDVKREAAGDREVDAALHDDEGLAEPGNRERGGERQHR
jgi:hypothetical protein